MSERYAGGRIAEEVGTEVLTRTPRMQALSPTAVKVDADGTLESFRRRRDSATLYASDAKRKPWSRMLVGERERRLYLLAPGEIDYIESRGNYVEFHADALVYISRDSIKRLSRELAASGFMRIQRTLLLNIQSIVYAQRVGHGTYAFTLSTGMRLRSGAKYRQEILKVLPLTRARRLDGG